MYSDCSCGTVPHCSNMLTSRQAAEMSQIAAGASALVSAYSTGASMRGTDTAVATQAAQTTTSKGAVAPAATPFMGPAGVVMGAAGIAAMML